MKAYAFSSPRPVWRAALKSLSCQFGSISKVYRYKGRSAKRSLALRLLMAMVKFAIQILCLAWLLTVTVSWLFLHSYSIIFWTFYMFVFCLERHLYTFSQLTASFVMMWCDVKFNYWVTRTLNSVALWEDMMYMLCGYLYSSIWNGLFL